MSNRDNIPNGESIDYKMYLEYLDSEDSTPSVPRNMRKHTESVPEKRAEAPKIDHRTERVSARPVKNTRQAQQKSVAGKLVKSSAQSSEKSRPQMDEKERYRRELDKKTASKKKGQKPEKSSKSKKQKGKTGKNGKKKSFFKRPGGIILIVVLVLAVLVAGGLGAYYWYMNDIGRENANMETVDKLPLDSEDDTTHGTATNELSASSLNQAIDQWYDSNNDNWMYNNKILNVLLIGMDDAKGDKYGRSDSMVLISVNTLTNEINMISFWRDSYGRIVHNEGEADEYSTHEKINGANAYGGPECIVSTLEHLYKIRIDGWVLTDFSKFRELIDAMGGISVDVTQAESEYLARTTKKVRIGYGKDIKLNGLDALTYCRIRHLDSDVMRAERQRKVLNAIIKKAGSLSASELAKAVKKFLPYLSTDYSKTEILLYATRALFGNWDEYTMTQQSAPLDTNTDSYTSGTINTAWVWVVDYPLAAQDVQKYLYGETKINLAQDRTNWTQLVVSY